MIAKEEVGTKPFYRPGDVITNSYGDKGVIVKAEVIIDGWGYEWNSKRETPTDGGRARPHYAIEWITRPKNFSDINQLKNAWWEAHEWSDVELGLLHNKESVE